MSFRTLWRLVFLGITFSFSDTSTKQGNAQSGHIEKLCFHYTVLCKSNESEMCEFRSLSLRIFREISPENSSVFSQCLERYFFKTKDQSSPHFREENEKILTGTITPVALSEISRCSALTSIEPSMYRLLVNNCTHIEA